MSTSLARKLLKSSGGPRERVNYVRVVAMVGGYRAHVQSQRTLFHRTGSQWYRCKQADSIERRRFVDAVGRAALRGTIGVDRAVANVAAARGPVREGEDLDRRRDRAARQVREAMARERGRQRNASRRNRLYDGSHHFEAP